MGVGDELLDRDTMVRRIEEESARMNVLVDDLLLLARLDQTRPAERDPVDLAVLAADACTDAVAVDPTRAVTLEAPRPVVVAGDRDHLRQAIANLMANALRHTPAGSPIEVERGDGRRSGRRARPRPRAGARRRGAAGTSSTASGGPTRRAPVAASASACRSSRPSPRSTTGGPA